jgi:pectate lyase
LGLLLSACSGDGNTGDDGATAGSSGTSIAGAAAGGSKSGAGGVPSTAGGSAMAGTSAGGPSVGGSVTPGGAGGLPSGTGAAGSSSGGVAGTGVGGSSGVGNGAGGVSGTARAGLGGTPNLGGSGTGTGGSGGGTVTGGVVGQPIGFAALNGGTTGGKAGPVVTATTFAELKSHAESATAQVILVQGTISNGANGGKISVKSNKSLVGVGSTAFLDGVGLEIANSNNIIVQNLRITMAGVTTRTETAGVYTASGDGGLPKVLVNDGDAISISGTSKNVWIDHCELFSEDPATQTNKDLYDGLIDVKGQAGFITISRNHLHDHHKGGLVGASDTDLFADRKITFHHNYYDNIKLRVPMYRGAVGHFFNNYIVGATDASEIRAGTCVRIEKNYYEALHYSIYTTSDSAGSTERIDNIEVMRTDRAYPANCTADIPYSYSAVLTGTTADVKTLVPQAAGVGKI